MLVKLRLIKVIMDYIGFTVKQQQNSFKLTPFIRFFGIIDNNYVII